jgi:two-component system, LytTR family, sensor kinase
MGGMPDAERPRVDPDWLADVRSPRVWALSFTIWTLLAFLDVGIRWTHGWTPGACLTYPFIENWLWALGTPFVLAFARRFPIDRERWLRHTALAAAVSLLVPLPYVVLRRVLKRAVADALGLQLDWELEGPPFRLVTTYLVSLLLFWEQLAVGHGLRYYRESRDRALRAARLEAQLARAQLQVLRLQLQPHFLFNTLHAISALLHRDPEAADRMIALLSDLLRLSLEDAGAAEVALRRELEFVDRYLEIEKARFAERLDVSLRVQPEALDALVPAFLLQPLVENAVQHGAARAGGRGTLGIGARRCDGRVELSVWDNGPGFAGDRSGGIGLHNTRARLVQLYGGDHAFEIRPAEAGGVEVRLSLPYRPAPAVAAPEALA